MRRINNKKENNQYIAKYSLELKIFLISFVFLFIISILYNGIYSIDEYLHFIISRNGELNPPSLITPFGKPAFSVLSFIFIKLTNNILGLYLIRLMNIIISSLTCMIISHIAIEKNYKKEIIYFGISILLITNIFFKISSSALSEPLFGLILSLSYQTYIKEKYKISVLLLSFSFLIRSEAVIFIAIFGFSLLKKRKIKECTLFIVFPIIWGILLLISGKNPIIIVTFNTYISEIESRFHEFDFLGRGLISFFYYIYVSPEIFGFFPLLIFILGFTISFFKKDKIILISLFIIFYIFEAILLMVPEFGSTGESRYFFGLLPFITFFYMDGLEYIYSKIKRFYNKSDLYDEEKTISVDNFNRFNFKKNEINKIYSIIILILIFSSGYVSLYSYIKNQYPTHDEIILQERAGIYLENNYDLKNVDIYCPVFGASHILSYLYHPYIYIDINSLHRSEESPEVVEEYLILFFDGFFVGNDFDINITDIKKNSVVIWYNIYNNNSYLNPKNVNELEFKMVYSDSESFYEIAIYEKK